MYIFVQFCKRVFMEQITGSRIVGIYILIDIAKFYSKYCLNA